MERNLRKPPIRNDRASVTSRGAEEPPVAARAPVKPAETGSDPDGEETAEIVRLQVYLAHAGVASRRKAEEIILAGRVTVNGAIVTVMGHKVSEADVVCVDGSRVSPEESKRYVLLNKPSGYVCSLADEKNRPVAADLLKDRFRERLYNVGRLDMYSAGAIIFTNDGNFASIVGHPSSEIEKEYVVEASLPFRDEVIESFKRGIRIENAYYRCKTAERLSSRRLRVVLVEGKNREIRKVFEHFGVRVKNLIRVRIGPVTMGDLKYGEFRELTPEEILALSAQTK